MGKKGYIYRFLDKNNKVIYVGRTTRDMRTRMREHFVTVKHLGEKCYRETIKVEYITYGSQLECTMYEPYFINKYKPKYNDKDKFRTLDIPKIDIQENWETFNSVYTMNKENPIVNSNEEKTKQLTGVYVAALFIAIVGTFIFS